MLKRDEYYRAGKRLQWKKASRTAYAVCNCLMAMRLCLGGKWLSPRLILHIPHKSATKAEKRRFFDQKSLNVAAGAENRWRDGDRRYGCCNMPNSMAGIGLRAFYESLRPMPAMLLGVSTATIPVASASLHSCAADAAGRPGMGVTKVHLALQRGKATSVFLRAGKASPVCAMA